MGIYSDLILEQENKKARQANNVTQMITSQPKSPQPVQPTYKRQDSPVNSLKDVTNGLANIGNDASNAIAGGVTSFANDIPQMVLGLGKDFVKGVTPLGFAQGIPAFARGFTAGAVDFVPSVVGTAANLGVDAINSYNGKQVLEHLPQERVRPMHTALEQWKEFQDTSNAIATPVVSTQTPEQLAYMGIKPVGGLSKYIAGNMPTSDWGNLWQGAGEFAVPLGTINKAGAAIKAANQASKVSKLTPKITQELSTRVSPKAAAKYKEQIARIAEDRAKQEVANGIQAPGKFRKFAGEMGKFGAIGATEGETPEDRLTNALGAMGVGAIAHGVGAGAKKAYNSKSGMEFRKNVADNFKQATDSYDWVSRTAAGIDATLNTNLSNNANGLTKIRRDYLKLRMASPSIAKMISPEQFKALVEAKKLTPEEYKELFETAKYGSRERAYNLAKQLESKLDNEAQSTEQKHSTTVKTQEEANKWFEEVEKHNEEQKQPEHVEDDLSHVKTETDINTPKQDEARLKNDYGMSRKNKTKKSNQSLKENQYIDEDGNVITKLDSGEAEGAGDLYKLTAEKNENIYKDVINEPAENRALDMDEAHKHKLEQFDKKYELKEVVDTYTNEFGETVKKPSKYMIINRATGKEATPQQKKVLRRYFQEYKERGITQDERARAEIEEAIEDDTYYDKYNDKFISEREVEENTVQKYKTNDQEFISWYDEYSKKTPNDKVKFLQKKLESFKNKEEQADFYNKFTEQGERESNSKRAKNLGDEYYDTSNVDEVEHLTEASKGVNTKLERTPNKVQTEKNSANFQKVVDSAWEKNFRKGRMNAKGRLQAKRDSASIQQEYDSIVNEIKRLKNTSAKVKQAMIKELNDIADAVVEGKKKFGVELNKSSNENLNLESDAVNKLIEANENKDLARGKAIIDEAGLKAEYLDEKGRKALQEHYMQSAEKANARLAELGMEVNVDINGNISVNLNEQKAVKWAKDQSKIRNAGNQVKLYKDLRHLDKHQETAVLRAKEEAKKILKANSRIIANDIINAFEKPQKSLKEIEGAKGTDKQYEYRETGDTWAKDSSDVDYGTRRARQTVEGLQRASEVKDTSISEATVKDYASRFENLSKKEIMGSKKYWDLIDRQYIKNSGKESVSASELPSTHFKEVERIDKFDKVGNSFDKMEVGEIPNELYAKYGENGFLKQYAKDYPNGMIEIVDSGRPNDGAGFNNANGHIIFNKSYKGKKSFKYICSHECRHAQQFADKQHRAAFKELVQITKELEDFERDNINTLKAIKKLRDEGVITIKENKNGLPNKHSFKQVEKHLGKEAAEMYNEYRQLYNEYKYHPLEVDANVVAKGVDNGQFRIFPPLLRTYVSRTIRGYRRRSGQKDKLDTPEGKNKEQSSWSIQEKQEEITKLKDAFDESKRFSKVLDWFDKNKSKAPAFYETFKQASSEKMKNLSDFYSSVSKSAEDLLLKYHRYTPERMKGRLFKQSQSGEGMYFLQGTEKSDRIVWEEDNGSSKYIKKLDGVKQKGTAEQTIARNLQRLAKMQHADTCVNFLKEHFKEKKEGYIPVNSDLLFTGMVDGKSRAWLKTLMEGEDSIRKTFDVNDAAEFTELYKTTNGGKADIYLPKDILAETLTGEKELALDYINTYGKRGLDGKVRGYSKLAGAMLDFYNDRFKRLVLTSGSFVFNNVMGNNIMLFANAESPADYIRSVADAFKLKDEQIPPEVLESTLAKSIMQEMQGGRKYFSEKDGALNTIARLIDGDLIDIKANSLHGTKRMFAHLANWGVARPNGVFRAISNAIGKINDGFERFSRKQAYSIVLRKINKQKMIKTAASMKGIEALAEAAKDNKVLRQTVVDKVEDILGDYNNFTNIEKKFFKRVFPFYAWNRTITRHIVHLAKDDPAMAFMVMYQTYRLLNQDDDLEDYQHGSLKTKMYNQKTKSNIVWNKANMIPYNTLFQMVTGEDHERIGTMTSAITKPLEAKRGKKFFLDQEITSKDYKKVSVDGKSGYMNTKTGEFKEGEAPWQVRAGYLRKDLLEKAYPMVGSPLTKSFKDKQYDASLGGYNHGDYIGKVKTSKGYKKKYRAAKNRLDTKYKLMNRVTGGWQPEHKVSKEQKEKYKNQRKRMRSN